MPLPYTHMYIGYVHIWIYGYVYNISVHTDQIFHCLYYFLAYIRLYLRKILEEIYIYTYRVTPQSPKGKIP